MTGTAAYATRINCIAVLQALLPLTEGQKRCAEGQGQDRLCTAARHFCCCRLDATKYCAALISVCSALPLMLRSELLIANTYAC